jgi:hypothetical protein
MIRERICNVCIKPVTTAPTVILANLGLRLHVACWRKLTTWSEGNPPVRAHDTSGR